MELFPELLHPYPFALYIDQKDTYLGKHNPDQFELIGMAAGNSRATGLYGDVTYTQHPEDRGGCGVVNNVRQYARFLIKR